MRDELWTKALKAIKGDGSVLQVWTSNNPQGFCYRQLGPGGRELVDYEGLALVKIAKGGIGTGQNVDPTED